MTNLLKAEIIRKLSLRLGLLFFVFIVSSSVSAQVYINEIMASNATVHADYDYGNYCDWIV